MGQRHLSVAVCNPSMMVALNGISHYRTQKLPIVSLLTPFLKTECTTSLLLLEIRLDNYQTLSKLLKNEHFDVVHIHANALINPIPLICCIDNRQKFVIHSHNTPTNSGSVARMIHGFNKVWLRHCDSARRVACSENAGHWMFGDKDFKVVNNAVDIQSYIFNPDFRRDVRIKYGIPEETYVIGTVGRMVEAKNYPFIISLFRNLLTIPPHYAKLLLVGDGPLRHSIEQLASDMANLVIFAGAQQNTAPFYSAMDCFVAPSLFEGLPIATVEAQASGVNIVVSDAIPDDANVSGLVNKLSLADPMEKWLELLSMPKVTAAERIARGLKLHNCAFDLPHLAKTIKSIYLK